MPICSQNRPGLTACPTAELNKPVDTRKEGSQFLRMALDDADIGARQAVFGQQRDGFKQRCAQVVVEVVRRKLLLSLTAQTRANVVGELCVCHSGYRSTQRNPA